MIEADAHPADSTLVRVAGLPIRYWLSGANPQLFEMIRSLERSDDGYRAIGRRLADQIGRELIPRNDLGRDDRALLLGVRRRVYGGRTITEAKYEGVLEILGRLSSVDDKLIRQFAVCYQLDRKRIVLRQDINDSVDREALRLLSIPGDMITASPVAEAVLPRNRHESGAGAAQSNTKKRCRGFDYAWKQVTRATTVSTPRDWLSHVALVQIDTATRPQLLAVTPLFTAQWTENVRYRRRTHVRLAECQLEPNTPLALNPLCWHEEGGLVFVVLDHYADPTRVAVRQTPLLSLVCSSLSDGPRAFDEVIATLSSACDDDRKTLQGFLWHLLGLGILQAGTQLRSQLETRAAPGVEIWPRDNGGKTLDGYVDVYRKVDIPISSAVCSELRQGLLQTLRLLALVRMDSSPMGSAPTDERASSWRLTDILKEHLERHAAPDGHLHVQRGWAMPTSPSSGYGRLVHVLASGLDDRKPLDISSELLDELDAPSDVLDWPVDCLLRLPVAEAPFVAVLGEVWPPAVLDARFVETLQAVHGEVPHVRRYREFLRKLEELTGFLFVEILAPPLSDHAANAVRRPLYTRAWTGDPHTASYLPADAEPGRYIPLERIRIRRQGERLHAEVDDRPIWPVFHATRSFSPPWDRLAQVLLAASPRTTPWAHERLDNLFVLFPNRRYLPRVTVAGQLVVAPAQWRLTAEDLWDSSLSLVNKACSLSRLRGRLNLPRWVYVAGSEGDDPTACDLESFASFRTFERCLRIDGTVRVMEMLPAPDQFPTADLAHSRGDRLATELVVRLPSDETLSVMADRIAADILSAHPFINRESTDEQ